MSMLTETAISDANESRARREVDQFDGACSMWQRDWTEEEFQIFDQSQEPHFFELTDGQIDFLGWPSWNHQWILSDLGSGLHRLLADHRLGKAVYGICPIRLRPGRWASPDISWHLKDRIASRPSRHHYFHGASGVMEILSDQDDWRELDTIRKRTEYALAKIPEYWIVDPETETITVLTLPVGQMEYSEHGVFRTGQTAKSVLLPEFSVDVTACFAAGKGLESP